MPKEGNKAIFLDRDGTINIDKEYLYRSEDFEYLLGAREGLRSLSDMGYLLVIITNQSGIARGYYTEDDYRKLDLWMQRDLKKYGIDIAGSYYCPHLPGGKINAYAGDCECRKPKTGLFWKAAKELHIDMNRSFAIGDKNRDLSICNESGVKGFLLSSNEHKLNGITVCKDWNEIICKIKHISED